MTFYVQVKKLSEGISLSPNTVASRVTDLDAHVEEQLVATANNFESFSIALGESNDVSDTAQCSVFIRGVDCSLNMTEEFLELIPLKGITTGRDVIQTLKKCINKYGLPWDMLVCLATDGAPPMRSNRIDLIGFVEKKKQKN